MAVSAGSKGALVAYEPGLQAAALVAESRTVWSGSTGKSML